MPPFIRQCWGLQVGPMHEEHHWHFVHKLWLCGVIKQQHPNWQLNPRWLGLNMIKVKKSVKVSICIVPPPHKASLRLSGIASIVKGYHSFTCTLCISSTSRMSHTCLCLPSRSWLSFTNCGQMGGWVDIGAKQPWPRFESATSRLQIRYSTTQPLALHDWSLRDVCKWYRIVAFELL